MKKYIKMMLSREDLWITIGYLCFLSFFPIEFFRILSPIWYRGFEYYTSLDLYNLNFYLLRRCILPVYLFYNFSHYFNSSLFYFSRVEKRNHWFLMFEMKVIVMNSVFLLFEGILAYRMGYTINTMFTYLLRDCLHMIVYSNGLILLYMLTRRDFMMILGVASYYALAVSLLSTQYHRYFLLSGFMPVEFIVYGGLFVILCLITMMILNRLEV